LQIQLPYDLDQDGSLYIVELVLAQYIGNILESGAKHHIPNLQQRMKTQSIGTLGVIFISTGILCGIREGQ
jgi:hypothetical protein